MKVTDRNEGIWHFNVIMPAYETEKIIILEVRKSAEWKTNHQQINQKNQKTRLMSTEKNAQLESGEFSYIWGKRRTPAMEITSQTALRNCSIKVRGGLRYVCDFSERKYMQSSTHFDRRSLLVPGRLLLTDVSFNDFNAFLKGDDTRSCAHKIFYWKFLSSQRSVLLVFVLFCFPEHRLPHTWSLPWAPFRMYCRLTTAFDYWPNPCTGRWQGTNFSWH